MTTGCRRVWPALLGPLLRALLGAALGVWLGTAGTLCAQAQQNANVPAGTNGQAQRTTPEDSDAAARAEADRLEAVGGDPEALLGAPAPPGDPYSAAFDSPERTEQALTGTEQVPRGALAGGRYGPQPAAKVGARPLVAAGGGNGNDDPRKPYANKADPGSQTPLGSALSIYHGSGDVGKAVGQVYKMPW
ncbi:hypothetical protein [Trinickia acidisoli]|uniref:hypothetical protein n=1 Tax=Trinickia acidisoli TaxID=2767482 RepID=UPI001A8C604E|nr:hypothetical protein [Trinickia acidisoli]